MARTSTLGLVVALAGCASTTQDNPSLPDGRVALRLQRFGQPNEITFGALRGRVVLVTVVTTWSDPALFEVPRLKELSSRFEKDLVIVCVALDESSEMIRIFKETFDIPYVIATTGDPAKFTGAEGPFGAISIIPTSVLIDRDGLIAARMDGAWGPGVLEAAVERLVKSR